MGKIRKSNEEIADSGDQDRTSVSRRQQDFALAKIKASSAIFAIQTYGDQLNGHPPLHSLLADGVWGKRDDAFQPIVWLDADILSSAFRRQVLAMMVSKRRLSAEFAQRSLTGATAAFTSTAARPWKLITPRSSNDWPPNPCAPASPR